jgi:integrase/recombinase XerC
MDNAIQAFLSQRITAPDYSRSTQMAYASDLRKYHGFLRHRLNHQPRPEDFSIQTVVEFLKSEAQVGRRRNTLLRRLATLKAFGSFLEQRRYIPVNPIIQHEEPFLDIFKTAQAPTYLPCLSAEQVKQLVGVMASSPRPRALRDQAMLFLLLETGLSVATLTDLNLTDLDLRSRRVHVHLGTEDLWLPLGEAAQPLSNYLQEGRPELIQRTDEPALFVSQMDGRLSRQGIWQILNHWGQQVDPPIALSPRALRQSAVMRMVQSNRSIHEISALLGHINPLSTRALIRRLELSCAEPV